jgi:hypothetical protein
MGSAVSWRDVHNHVAPILEQVDPWPMVGTPEWCALPDSDPRKLAALLDAAQHWALRVETCQAEHHRARRWTECATRHAVIRKKLAEYQASHAISATANWAAIAQHHRNYAEFYAARPWLRRETA